jgi:hypothetical protein
MIPLRQQLFGLTGIFRVFGLHVVLVLTKEQVNTLSDDDVAALREVGASDQLIWDVRLQARKAAPERIFFELDLDQQTVTVSAPER